MNDRIIKTYKKGNLKGVKSLIAKETNLQASDLSHLDILLYLNSIGCNLKEYEYFRVASRYGDLDAIKYLVSLRCVPKAFDNLAIRYASANGRLEVVKYLYKVGCDPKACDNRAIRLASEMGHLDVVKYLYKKGCDPKAYDNYSIRWASASGHLEVVKYLVSVGCDPTACDNRAIQWASLRGHLEVAKYLLEIGCDHEEVKKSVKFIVLQEIRNKLLFFLNRRLNKQNKYLKMEILYEQFSTFTFAEIFSTLSY